MGNLLVHFAKYTPFLFFLTYIFTVRGGSSWGALCYLINILLGMICIAYVCLYKKKPSVVISMMAMFLLLSVTFLLSPSSVYGWKYESIGEVPVYKEYMKYAAFFLSFFIGYVIEMKSRQTDGYWTFIGVTFSAVAFLCYSLHLTEITLTRGTGYQNNESYLLISAIPFAPLFFKYFKRRIIPIAFLVAVTVLVINASKRGAIVCLLASWLLMMFYHVKENGFTVKKVIQILIVAAALVVALHYLIYSNEYLMQRIERMEERNYGARSIAYPTMWKYWIESPTLNYFFGGGLCHSVAVWGNFAHNDWLELLCSNGLLGVCLYLGVFISSYVTIYRSRMETWVKLSAYLCLLIWFLKSIFSMGYSDTNNCIWIMFFGAIIAKISHQSYSSNG